jgi:integrase
VQTKREAEAYERALRQNLLADDVAGRDPFAGPPPTFAEFSERWMRDYVIPNNRPATQRDKIIALRAHLLPEFGRLRLDEISVARIDAFKAKKVGAHLAPKTVNNLLSMLHCALATATDWGLLRTTPRAKWLRLPVQGYHYLSADDVQKLLAATRPGLWQVLVLFLVRTGVRFGEAAALRWDDLELRGTEPVAHIRRGVNRGFVGPTKTGRPRDVPLVREVVAALDEYHHDRPYVFSRPDGAFIRPDVTRKYLHRICARAGIPLVSWHALRHTFATELTARGAPLRAVQELLGHTTIMMTSRYAHVAPSTLRSSVALLERLSPRRLDDAPPSRLGDGHRRAGTRPRSLMMPLAPAA